MLRDAQALAKLTAFQSEVKPFVSAELLSPKNIVIFDVMKKATSSMARMALTHFEAELYVALMQTVGKPQARCTAVEAAHSWIVENAEDADPSKCHPLLWTEATKIMKGVDEC